MPLQNYVIIKGDNIDVVMQKKSNPEFDKNHFFMLS